MQNNHYKKDEISKGKSQYDSWQCNNSDKTVWITSDIIGLLSLIMA